MHIVNAYLEAPTTIVVKYNENVTLPLDQNTLTIVDQTLSKPLAINSVDIVSRGQPVLVGDLQHLLGAKSDWNPKDDATEMRTINSNLYQFRGTLPAGTYNYKVAFNDAFDGAIPDTNLVLTVAEDNTEVTFSYVPHDLTTKHSQVYDSLTAPDAMLPTSSAGIEIDLLAITLAESPNITHELCVTLEGDTEVAIKPRNVLSDAAYVYIGDDLGCTYAPHATAFRVWSPTASDMQLLLYSTEDGPLTIQVAMIKSDQGTWYAQVQQDIANWYYLYQVTILGATQTAVDPYARAIAVNATRGMVVNLDTTNPDGWQHDTYRELANAVDAVIYEVHVRDFSIAENSGMTNKGRYLGFTERDTKGPGDVSTGVESLKELGITHVQVLPVAEFASVDETVPTQYNWGYDPRNYNVPEGAYASTPHGIARIREYKQMIQSLHKTGIGVVMDVVYNHTFEIHTSDFDKLVPQYYYRTNYDGYYMNGSGVGNELATEKPMVQKFVRDSLKYWTREYHIDGFRFDLMALLSVDTMKKVADDLQAIHPGHLIYGEPWAGGGSALSASQLLTKGQQKGTAIGCFNDHLRNAIAGSVFHATTRGFVNGASGLTDAIGRGVMGSIDDFTSAPHETINYVASHDNYTLWDKLTASTPAESEADRAMMDILAMAILMTSQGIAFVQGGEEFLRTKSGNENSYNAGDGVNQFYWERKHQYLDVFNYYAGLIHLRTNHPAFRMTSANMIRQHLAFLPCPDNTVAFMLANHANGDTWEHILVIYNPNKAEVELSLPEGNWSVVTAQGRVGEETLEQVSGTVVVPPLCCMILHT